MTQLLVRYAVEGWTDEPVADKLLRGAGFLPIHTLTAGGKTNLDPKLSGLNRASAGTPWLVLRDLDRDDAQSCIPELLSTLLNGEAPSTRMCLRLAVRAVEAWLLADRESFASHFDIRRPLPENPEVEPDPKATVVNFCRGSGRRDVREGMVPRQGSGRKVGPEYVALVRAYAELKWDPEQARASAPSLDRAIHSLTRMSQLLG